MSDSAHSTSPDETGQPRRPRAIVFCEANFGQIDGKTANGLVRNSERYEIISVIDSQLAGQDTGVVLDLRDQARSTYATWIERAKETSEVSSTIQTDIAVALIDFQLTNVLVQMSLGEDPALLRAQAQLSFAGLR